MNFIPSYIKLLRNGELNKRAEETYDNLVNCASCPRDCKVNRIEGELEICTSGHLPIVSSYTPHFGEEPVLSGTNGAGIQTIFGGNISLLTELCEKSRTEAFDMMVEHAQQIGANALVGVRYDTTELMSGVTEVLCYGTAVVLEKIN
jgi:uncharacterized protein YbjQ (UPF0145 family)